MARKTPSRKLEDLVENLDAQSAPLSPEVEYYLVSRGYEIPKKRPLYRTKEPRDVPGAMFDPARVDKVLKAVEALRHTKGKWAGKPLRMESIQVAYFIAPIFGWVHEDSSGDIVRIIRNVWIEMPRKGAKALDLDTPMLTTDGWSTIRDIEPGVHVYSEQGAPVEVLATSEVFEGNDCFKVVTSDGREVVADADHLWTVRDRQVKASQKRSAWVTMTTRELVEAGITKGVARPELRWELPRQHGVEAPVRDLAIDPYLLGYWLGDGSSAPGRITVGDMDVEAFRAAFGEAIAAERQYGGPGTAWTMRMAGLQAELRRAGLLDNKHIPEDYLLGSHDQRLALLRGLMDSDGTVDKGRGHVSFVSTRRVLADGVAHLARTLGYRPSVSEARALLDGRDCGPVWKVSWKVSPVDDVPFALPRKAGRIAAASSDDRRFSVSIKSIERVESRPTKCIMVDSEDGLFLAGRDLMVTHNSTLMGALSFYMAFADGEGGAEVLLGAASKDQARLAYAPLRELVLSSTALQRAGIKATRTTIEKAISGSVLKAVSSRGDLAHGANIHGGLLDELHVHKTPDLLEAFETGTGARNQPIVFIITTADDGSTTSVYAQRRDKIERIATGVLKSTSTYGVIFAVPKEADPFAEATWDMANPLYPVTPSPEFMRAQVEDAQSSEVALASFLRLHLGIRSDRATRFFPMDRWVANAGLVDEAKLRGREAYGGIDLGSTSDLTALSWIFPDGKGGFDNVVRFWMPEEALPSLDARTMKMASTWVKQGYIRLTPGDVTDYEFIRRQIESDLEMFDVVQVGYDPWNAQQLVNNLNESQAPMVKVVQGIRLMSPALKELDRLIRTGTAENPVFRHGGNPVLRWNADNVRVREDANGNIAPDKKTSMDKIDGISATLTALSTFLSVENMVSAYEDHRMEVV